MWCTKVPCRVKMQAKCSTWQAILHPADGMGNTRQLQQPHSLSVAETILLSQLWLSHSSSESIFCSEHRSGYTRKWIPVYASHQPFSMKEAL